MGRGDQDPHQPPKDLQREGEKGSEEGGQTEKELHAIKRNEIMPFTVTWMGLEIVIQNEVSQKEKDK